MPDAYGNMWVLDWVTSHLGDPAHLLDTNIYFPHRHTLTFNEGLFAQSLEALPFVAAGGTPLLVYNLIFLLTYPLAGLGAYLLARDLTGSRGGALLAGLAYAFSAFRLNHLPHVHTLSIQWFPLVLLALRRTMAAPSRGWAAALVAFCVLQAWSTGYYAALLAPVLLVALAAGWRSASARGRAVALGSLAVAAVLSAVPMIPYWLEARALGLSRSREECIHWSAAWSSYLDPSDWVRLPYLRVMRDAFATGEPLYPGTAVVVLAAVALVRRRRHEAVLLLAGLAVTGVALSLGPEMHFGPLTVPGPFELVRTLPGYRLLRTPGRMGVIAVLALTQLAALGWTALGEGRTSRLLRGALLLVTLAEAVTPTVYGILRPIPPPPPVASWLASAPRGAVLELPWDEPADSAIYVYWSTAHRQPMVNGWGSFEPQDNYGLARVASCCWPRPYAVNTLRDANVRYVVAHLDRMRKGMRDRIALAPELPPGVRLEAQFESDWVYSIGPRD